MSRQTEVCGELDEVLMNVMATLDELSALRKKYSDAVSEVSSIFIFIRECLLNYPPPPLPSGIFLHVSSTPHNGWTIDCFVSSI